MALRILHFIEAVTKHVADGCAKVSQEELAERLTACQGCRYRNGLECSKCGCGLALKASWRSESCPDDPPRWPSVTR